MVTHWCRFKTMVVLSACNTDLSAYETTFEDLERVGTSESNILPEVCTNNLVDKLLKTSFSNSVSLEGESGGRYFSIREAAS